MRSSCLKWIFTIFLFLKISSAYEFSNFDFTNVEILEDETVLRHKRQVVEGGSGEVICESTPTQDCFIDNGVCFCECKENFYDEEGQGCVRGKIFGGNITFTDDLDEETCSLVNETVNMLFNSTEDLVKIYIDSIESGSIIVRYILTFKNVADVNKESVELSLQEQLNCSDSQDFLINNLTLDVKSSCETVISDGDEIICSSVYNNCDGSSTVCSSSDSGYLECRCKANFRRMNETACLEQICVYDQDCNSPFGWCVTDSDGVSSCTCMWGFDGLRCYQPWLFTLTVVGASCVVIILSLIISLVCCLKKKKTKKPTKELVEDEDSHSSTYQANAYPLGMMRARVPSAYDRANSPSTRNYYQSSYGENEGKSGHANKARSSYTGRESSAYDFDNGRKRPSNAYDGHNGRNSRQPDNVYYGQNGRNKKRPDNANDVYNGRKSGRSNTAYDGYASSTTTFNSPQRGRHNPNEYF